MSLKLREVIARAAAQAVNAPAGSGYLADWGFWEGLGRSA
jgi:hypothetical protein